MKPDVWIQTFTGEKFNPFNPGPDMINIWDIAHALSMKCRYTGHCKHFFSVAQHSVLVSCYTENKLAGLLHDASEAYLPDVARPVKPYIKGFKEIEDNLLAVIFEKFGLDFPMSEEIKIADGRMCFTEGVSLMPDVTCWELQAKPYNIEIHPVGPEKAMALFLKRFYELKGG